MRKICLLVCLNILTNTYCYEYPRPVDGYFSQRGQDKFLNEHVFNGKWGGFFVEVGAHDGVSFSNTYFFEKNLGWAGICVEPNPDIFEKLVHNRTCLCELCCITGDDGPRPFLKCSGYLLEMYSGLLDTIDPRHAERIDVEMTTYGGGKEIISVPCRSFAELFKKYGVMHVDFLSLDIEGGEEAALRSIDFGQVTIDVIVVENNFNEDVIKNYLESYGYERIERIGKDDVYRLMRVVE